MLTVIVLSLQVAVPVVLLWWLGLHPAPSRLGVAMQVAGTGAFLLALALVAQWAVPVWWLPYVYGVIWIALVLWRSAHPRRRVRPWRPTGTVGWAGLIVAAALLALGGGYGTSALLGRMTPDVEIVDIANPFGPGLYLVGNGGSTTLVNAHVHTLDPSIERFRSWRGQSYAVDFFGLGPWGMRARGWWPSDPARYAIFGAGLYAPCDGRVVAAEGAMEDFEVPNQDPVNRLGNHVIIDCGDLWIVFAHMRQGSLSVQQGAVVGTGDTIGAVGNSGASSEPHLHIHAQRPVPDGAAPISGAPLALRIEGRFLVRGDLLSGKER